ncbi:MAG: type II secretion system major pseudopilin GspG [Candidatus Binatia bacterium]
MRGNRKEAGFTLIELLVVMVIIGLLAALVGPNIMGAAKKGEMTAAKAQLVNFSTALDAFRLDNGRYPNTQEGLQALIQAPSGASRWDGPYLKKEVPLDPWGRPYVYRSPGENKPYDLFSYGADGTSGGEGENADIVE